MFQKMTSLMVQILQQMPVYSQHETTVLQHQSRSDQGVEEYWLYGMGKIEE